MTMSAVTTVLLSLAPLLGALPAPPAPAPGAFLGWFEAAAEGRLRLPEAVEQDARRHRYVFVEGLYNERMPGYFAQNARELRAHGVPRDAIHFIAPSSHKPIGGNFDEVRSRFLEIAAEGPEPLVVIAHSRGACDALAFALHEPEFVRDRVLALFLIQGPFGGTGAADYVGGEAPEMDGQLSPRLRALVNVAAGTERWMRSRGKHGGLPGLTRPASQRFWERTLRENADAIPIVGPKTFYITAETSPPRLRPFKRAIASYLTTYYGPNDGLVLLTDQSLPGLGTVLAVLDAGHTDLTNRAPSAQGSRQLRRSLIQSILMVLGGGEGSDDVPPPPRRRRGERPGTEG
jgi:pimeloyl-ACP methyl ester carboxylesterase